MPHIDPITGTELVNIDRFELQQGVGGLLQLAPGDPSQVAQLTLQNLASFSLDALLLLEESGLDQTGVSSAIGAGAATMVFTCPSDYRYWVQFAGIYRNSGDRNLTALRMSGRSVTGTQMDVVQFTGTSDYLWSPTTPVMMSPGDKLFVSTGSGGSTNSDYFAQIWYRRCRIFAGYPTWASED